MQYRILQPHRHLRQHSLHRMWHRPDRQTDLRTGTVTTAITVRAVTGRIIVTTVDRTSVARAVTTVTTETAIVTIVRVATDRGTVRADRMVTEEVWAMADLREEDLTDRVVRVWKAVRVIAAVTAMVSAVTAITAATEEAMADRVIDSEITDRIRASLRNLQVKILRRSAKMKRDVSVRRRTTSVPRRTISTKTRTH